MKALRNDQGMTMVEIIAVLLIIGIIATIFVVKFTAFGETAKEATIAMAVAELNERERMTWSLVLLDPDKDYSDQMVYDEMNFDLGQPTWQSRNLTGGVLQTEGGTTVLVRTPSTKESHARWKR